MEKTLLKGLAVLETLIANGKPTGVSDLALQLRLSKSNTHRLLNTLLTAGFVTTENSRYTVSLKTWELGVRIMDNYDVRSIARPVMEKIAKATSESVRLSILDTARVEAIIIDAIESSHVVRPFTELATRLPAHCTSSGKALLAFQDRAFIEAIAQKLKAHTRWTITDSEKFIRHLDKVRRDGYATNLREYDDHVRSVAAPIFTPDGKVIASISIAAPAERITSSALSEFTQVLCAGAQKISASMQSTGNVVDLYGTRRRKTAAKTTAARTARTALRRTKA